MNNNTQPRSQWSSFNSYVLVTTGAIVGLGNIFQFPFMVTKYGALFLLFYFLCQFAIALPLLFAELLIGRRGKQNPVGTLSLLAMEAGASRRWRCLGWFGVLLAFLTLSYYTVNAAFPVGYFADSLRELSHQSGAVNTVVTLDNLAVSHFAYLAGCFVVLLALAMAVVFRGINRGLEQISRITVPTYFSILLILAVYMSFQGHFSETFAQFIRINNDVPLKEIFLSALALSFLKYNVGMGVMIVYGSYLPYHVSLGKSTLVVVAIDIIISLLSFFIIYPLVVSANPSSYFTVLSSHSVINVFSSIPYGLVVTSLFFFAAILAAWTPIISMAEVVVLTLVERLGMTRAKATILVFLAALLLGGLEVASHLQWADVKIVGDQIYHNFLKNTTMDILAPISAFFVAIFVGWVMKRQATEAELRFDPPIYHLWRFLVRFVAPLAIVVVFVTLV